MQVRAEPIGNDWDLEEILDVVPLKDRIISTDIVTATVCITPHHNTTQNNTLQTIFDWKASYKENENQSRTMQTEVE